MQRPVAIEGAGNKGQLSAQPLTRHFLSPRNVTEEKTNKQNGRARRQDAALINA